MKRLILFCTNEEVKELFNYCTKDFKNSLIKYDSSNHNFYFFSHYNESYEQVEISYNILQFDNNLINVIKEILKTSYQKIKEISDEPFGPFVEDEIYSEIFS